jgi:hypothetical protein
LGNPSGGVLNGTSVLPQNLQLHIALVYDHANGVESLYVNGTIDQFSIYDGALSESQIAGLFAAGPVAVPEASTFALAGIGLAGLLIFRRRK